MIDALLPPILSPLSITLERIVTSILPPDTRQQTFLPSISGILPFITAATGTAPAPSETSFCCSIRVRIARAISSSLTV